VLSKVINRVLTVMAVLAGILLFYIAFSVSYQILLRSFRITPPLWMFQCNDYALLWITMLGAAWLLAKQKHVAVDIVTGRLKPGPLFVLKIIHNTLGIAVSAVIMFYSAIVTVDHFRRGIQDVGAVDVPKAAILIIIPIGFFMLTVQFIRNLIAEARAGRAGPPREEKAEEVVKGLGFLE
jgi:TRAP-type C4-dicarboxylate transport system permease small subunit